MKTLLNRLTGHWAFGSGMLAIATLPLLATLPVTAQTSTPYTARGNKRIIAFVFGAALSCLCLLPPALAAPGSWTQKADMPGQTSATSSCVVDGILYVIGGHYPYPSPLRTVWAYDPRTDSWTRKADMPTARNFLAAAAVDGIIYVIGGAVAPKKVEAYDPRTDIWETNKADMPTGRATHAACTVDGIIYAIGGSAGWPTPSSALEAYDPKTNQWTKKSNMPKGLVFLTASAADGLIYVFSGTETFAYDPKTDHWTAKAQYSPWSYGLMSSTLDGIIYLFGGMSEDMYGSFDFVLAYDPAQDRFSARRKMPRTRLVAGCGVIDGKIYLAAGISKEPVVNPDEVYYTVLDVFDPQGGIAPHILSLACESTNRVRLAWQGEAGLRYGVQSTAKVANGPWTRNMFAIGTNSVLATNAMVEATCLVPTADTNRFFRVLEL
ncbi:MAG TPA: kelch repeat-containing protein [Candidatus Paceibacterota bacterium]|nr:kelch repeat-containing protein [Candidatus Paceibacterota bacterium]